MAEPGRHRYLVQGTPRRTDRSIACAGRERRAVVSLFWPNDRSACSSGRPASRPGTTPLSVYPERACGGFPPRGWQSFFERLNRIGALFVGPRPRAHMRKAQFLQGPVHRIVGNREAELLRTAHRKAQFLQGPVHRIGGTRKAELLVQAHDQIAGPPAYHAVDGGDRSLIYDACQKCLVLVIELTGGARRWCVYQPLWALFVKPDTPVPQRLTIHAAGLGGLFPRGPVENRRYCQQPSRLSRISCSLRQPPNRFAREVRPNRKCLSHGKRISVCHVE